MWPYWSFIWEFHETSYRRTNGKLWIRTTESSWWRTTETSLGVSFETCLRRHGDVLMGRHNIPLRRHYNILIRRRGDVPVRRLGDVPLIRRRVFHFRRTCDVTGTYRETSLRCSHSILLPGRSSPFFKILFTIFFTSAQFISRFRINSEVFSPYSYSCQSYLHFIKYRSHNWYNWSNWLLQVMYSELSK